MKIFVVNANDWYNKGDVTNRLGLVLTLKEAFRDKKLEIYMETLTPKEDKKYFERIKGVKIIKSVFATETRENTIKIATQTLFRFIYFIVLFFLIKLFPSLRKRNIVKNTERTEIGEILDYITLLYNSNIIISSPGGFLHDDYPPILILNLVPLMASILLGKPLIIFNQSIGPFKSKLLKKLVEVVICRSKLITLRELASGWKPPKRCNYLLTTDSTFSIKTHILGAINKGVEKAERILRDVIRDANKHMLIGITLVGYFILSKGKERLIRYIATLGMALKEINDRLNSTKNLHFIVIPQNSNKYELEIIEKIVDIIKRRYRVRNLSFIKEDLSPEEIIAILNKIDVLVASRMHSAIFASIVSTPSIMLAYQPKFKGIASSLGLESNVIDIISDREIIPYREVVEKVLKTLKYRKDISERLNKITKRLELKAKVSAYALRKIVED